MLDFFVCYLLPAILLSPILGLVIMFWYCVYWFITGK